MEATDIKGEQNMETEFKVGDKIEIIEVGENSKNYYSVGDIGVVISSYNNGNLCSVDFNNQNNKKVRGRGIWGINSEAKKKATNYAQFKIYQEKPRFSLCSRNGEKMAKNKTPLEIHEQEKFFSWINENKKKYPELALAHCSLNGVKLSPGAAVKAKKQGMVAGVPDIFLPISTITKHGDCYGLFIELKRIKGSKVSPEQKLFMAALEDQGYKCSVCYGADEAIETIKQYLNIKE